LEKPFLVTVPPPVGESANNLLVRPVLHCVAGGELFLMEGTVMRLGAVFPQAEFSRVDGNELVTFVQRLEGAGYDHLLVFDHVLGADSSVRPGWDGPYDHRDPFLEPLVLFAYLARACNLELVTDILVLPQRQSALVAKQVATLELLAPGRLRLGVGIGWNAVEYDALGIDFHGRATRMEEQIALLRRLWSEPSIDHAGRHDTVDAAGIAPLPPRRVPVWVGCGTDSRAVKRVGRLADGWLPIPQIQPGYGFEAAWQEVRTAAVEAGRAPGQIGLEGHIRVRPDDLNRFRDRVARWSEAGAEAIAVNPLRAGARWPDGHLDLLLRAAELTR
jgi:probable F420-dependent oxidoreductase